MKRRSPGARRFAQAMLAVLLLLPSGLARSDYASAYAASFPPQPPANVASITPQPPPTAVAVGNGPALAWGFNGFGQLGNGSNTDSSTPVSVSLPSGTTVTAIAGGETHSLAVTSTGSALAWGDNSGGELGNGTRTNSSTPTPVSLPGGTTVTAVAAGDGFSLARTSTGSALAWGANGNGRLGSGTTATFELTPVPVSLPSGTTVSAIAAGAAHGLAVTSTGSALAWGFNHFGQLGNGTRVDSNKPVPVKLPTGTTITAIAGGSDFSLALTATGSVLSWGHNNFGQLGDGTTTDRTTPVPVSLPSGTTITAISGGGDFSLALTATGSVLAWGHNNFGQLGNGTTTDSKTPVPVSLPSGTTVTAIAAGDTFALALTSGGSVVAWGQNGNGQLGNGTMTDSRTPVSVSLPSGTTVSAIAAGSAHSLVITLAAPPPPPPNTPTTQEIQGGGSPDVAKTTCDRGRPVNCATGEFWHAFVDLSIPGRGLPLLFTRTYSSLAAAQDGPLGFGWTHSYNMFLTTDPVSGDVTVHEENSSAITFRRTPSGFQAPSRVRATLVENSDGTFTMIRKNQSRFTFSRAGRLLKTEDRNGETTTLAYSASGQLVTVSDPAGRTLTLSYSGNHLTSVRDPIGRTVSLSYDANGNLLTATDVGGGVTRFRYDPNHLLLAMTDPRGGVLTNAYDSARRVVAQTDPMNRTTRFSYGAGGTTITDPNGNVTVQLYQNNLLVALTRGVGTPQAATRTYTYDPVSLGITSATDENGHIWTYVWDARGNLLSGTDPLGRTMRYTYSALNDVTSVTEPAGATTTLTYDGRGNLTTIARPLGAAGPTARLTFAYDDPAHPGDVIRVTDPEEHTWTFTYDVAGNPVRVSDPLGDTGTTQYDAISRLIAQVTPRGNVANSNPAAFTTTIAYNAFGDPLRITDPLGDSTLYQYDPNRNLVGVTDGNGHKTQYAYDADDEVIGVTKADGTTLAESYDANGNLVGETNGVGATAYFSYDALNRLIARTDALGRTTHAGYDPIGNQTSVTDPQGRTITVTYDAANQLIGISYSDGTTPTVAYTYDANGRRSSMNDGTGTTRYTYDGLSRLIRSVDGAGQQLGYGYDLAGNLTTLTYPDGTRVTRSYDAANRLGSVTDFLGNATSFAYDANGNLVRQTYPNGTVATFIYDAANRSLAIRHNKVGQDARSSRGHHLEEEEQEEPFLSFRYERDSVGLLTAAREDGVPQDGRTRYVYDPLDRLTRVTNDATTAFRYDRTDALTEITGPENHTTTLTYDAATQLTTRTVRKEQRVIESVRYDFDANGNRIGQIGDPGGTTRYGYDQENRLISLVGPRPQALGEGDAEDVDHGRSVNDETQRTVAASYAYNGDGLRMSKTVNGARQAFVWGVGEGMPLVIEEGTTRYITGPGSLPLEQVAQDGTVLYYHQDQLGSTRGLTDPAGKLAAVYSYDPYGNPSSMTGKVANPLQYAGQYTDAESRLQYLRNRYYEPAAGQFLSSDPLTTLTGQPYMYAAANPLNGSDPNGLYEYWTKWGLGHWGPYGAEIAMHIFQSNPNSVFPWTILDANYHKSPLVRGGQYHIFTDLPRPCLIMMGDCLGPDPVQITAVTPTSLSLVTLPGHIEGEGATITFAFYYDQQGNLILEQHAVGPDSLLHPIIGQPVDNGRMLFVKSFWGRMAQKMAAALQQAYAANPCSFY